MVELLWKRWQNVNEDTYELTWEYAVEKKEI